MFDKHHMFRCIHLLHLNNNSWKSVSAQARLYVTMRSKHHDDMQPPLSSLLQNSSFPRWSEWNILQQSPRDVFPLTIYSLLEQWCFSPGLSYSQSLPRLINHWDRIELVVPMNSMSLAIAPLAMKRWLKPNHYKELLGLVWLWLFAGGRMAFSKRLMEREEIRYVSRFDE